MPGIEVITDWKYSFPGSAGGSIEQEEARKQIGIFRLGYQNNSTVNVNIASIYSVKVLYHLYMSTYSLMKKYGGCLMKNFRCEILKCLGSFPDSTALEPSVVSSVDKGDHILQLVSYNVEADERINAYLLSPKKLEEKAPAVLALHQHNGEYFLGKSEPAGLSKNEMYHYGLELCRRGYVVLCPDNLGFEDRRPMESCRRKNPDLEGASYERMLFCRYILNGSSLQAKYLHDLACGIDYLQTLEHIDGERIGAVGHSLGGQEALWLTWYDSRIKAAASSCGLGQVRSIVREGINHNFAMFSFGFLKIGDIADLVCDLAPRPFMMTSGSQDKIFPLDGVHEIISAAKEAYAEKGAEGSYKAVVFEDGHTFTRPLRLEAYQWLDKFLLEG